MEAAKQSHRIVMEGRKKVEVSGVLDLLVFDETEVVMETSEGMLSIRGADLHNGQFKSGSGTGGTGRRNCRTGLRRREQ